MRTITYALILNLVFSFSSSAMDNACERDFLVIDIGSSTTKGMLYTKDLCNKKVTLKKQFFNQNYPYQACLSNSKSKSLPTDCINGGIQAIESIKQYFKIDCHKNCFAFATGWARYIENQDEWISKVNNTGVQTKIASQEYEGRLKLIALKNELHAHSFIGFDIGGGSFQLVWEEGDGIIHHYNSHYGTDNFTHDIQEKLLSDEAKVCVEARHKLTLFKLLGKNDVDKDALSLAQKEAYQACNKSDAITFDKTRLDEAIAYADQKIGQPLLAHTALQSFIKTNKPVVYADTLLVTLGIKKQLGLNKDKITLDDIYKIMTSISGMNLTAIQSTYPDLPDGCVNTTQSSMLILYTIMKSLGIHEIHAIETDYMDSFINSQIK
jgi:hypothetical protein